jgi:hypothetical protein
MTRILVVLLLLSSTPAFAQQKPAPPAKPTPAKPAPTQKPATAPARDAIGIRGFFTVGQFAASARDTFEAVLETNTGMTFGGGGHVLLPRGFYAEVAAWRFREEGERVFVGPNQEVFPLGIPLEITLTPLEVTGGWRYRHCPRRPKAPVVACRPSVVPYLGGGWSSYRYQETSEFANDEENVDARFNGFHVLGGAEFRVLQWLAVGGEVAWSSVPDALGAGGVSEAFDETNLGGTSLRLKVSIGR